MASLSIALKRVYEEPSDDDGLRILVERLWPRGLTKAAARVDHWAKDVAPSPTLRTWYGHRPERWDGFRRRYARELQASAAAVEALRHMCEGRPVTFVFAARDPEHNSAVLLREHLLAPDA